MQEWKVSFNAANGSLTFFDLDMVLEFLDAVGVLLPNTSIEQELRDGEWSMVSLHRGGDEVGQLERI